MPNSPIAEKFVSPKEIAAELQSKYGLTVSIAYVRAVRTECANTGQVLFAGGMARASEVFAWLRAHPDFKMRGVVRKAA